MAEEGKSRLGRGLAALIGEVGDEMGNLERKGFVPRSVPVEFLRPNPRNNLSGQVVADVRQFMGNKVYETMIPRNVRVSEAPSHGKPVLLYDLKCAGSQAYLRLASEVIQRERALRAA